MFDDLREVFLLENKEFCVPEIVVFGHIGVAISGHKGIMKINNEEIILRVKGGALKINGYNLKIFNMSGGDIGIFGDILGVNYV